MYKKKLSTCHFHTESLFLNCVMVNNVSRAQANSYTSSINQTPIIIICWHSLHVVLTVTNCTTEWEYFFYQLITVNIFVIIFALISQSIWTFSHIKPFSGNKEGDMHLKLTGMIVSLATMSIDKCSLVALICKLTVLSAVHY